MEHMNEPVDRSTLDEMVRYTKRITTLKGRLGDAEAQFLQRWASAYRAGRVSEDEIVDAAMDVAVSGHLPAGWMARWSAAFGLNIRALVHQRQYQAKHSEKHQQNAGHGWVGTCDAAGASFPRPAKGQCVVYVLFDATTEPVYVGSTQDFSARIRAHQRDGKPVAHWRAVPYTTREDAYAAEEAMLQTVKPMMNRKAGR